MDYALKSETLQPWLGEPNAMAYSIANGWASLGRQGLEADSQ